MRVLGDKNHNMLKISNLRGNNFYHSKRVFKVFNFFNPNKVLYTSYLVLFLYTN